ncbi:DUF4335 domain-containing protein [Chamaesiphon sp.]|uniref:DUF4335 domain-containing protein n=1 Tax=Chamaesiphon sp. TaxID=2814140 RepID=UPI003592FB3B
MTIRRQYSLPNCTLILDGLSDGTSTTGIPDPRPLMSSLFNAEFHFVGSPQPLLGGRDFLTSLVTTVSDYAQEFLSGIPHPSQPQTADRLVSLVRGDRDNIHRLQAKIETYTPQPPGTTASSIVNDRSAATSHGTKTDALIPAGATNATQSTQVDLSTIQLFDLLEAIDQFLADRRTLPDIMIPLQPVTKAIAQPISAQAVPAGLGLASLVVASLIGYALPAPQVLPPKSLTAPVVTPTPTTTPASSTPAPTSNLPSKTGRINEATQIGFLERKLQRDLNQNWLQRSQLKQAANFQVNVNQDGQIVSYLPVGNTTGSQSSLTPLTKLSTQNTDPNQAIGNFNVVFNPTGVIEIAPIGQLQGIKSLGKAITEPQLQTTLATQLQTTLQASATSTQPLDPQNLTYRVAVTKTGEIADYEPTDRRAAEAEAKTPLPKLAKFNSQAAISQEPLAQYQVIFQPDGKILVTPK